MIKISEKGPKRTNLDKAINKLIDELPEGQKEKITSLAQKVSSGGKNKGNVTQLCHKFGQPRAKVYNLKKQSD